MSKNPEELKAMLAARLEQRKEAQAAEVEKDLEIELPMEDLEEFEEDGTDFVEMLENAEMGEILSLIEEAGFTGYVAGYEIDSNPHADNDVAMAEAWAEGWYSAHVQACVANIMLTAKALVEAADETSAGEALAALEEAVKIAEEAIDFNETQEFWDALMENVGEEVTDQD